MVRCSTPPNRAAIGVETGRRVGPGVYQAALETPVITVTVDDKVVTILDEDQLPENVQKVLARGKNKNALGVVPENVYTPDWAWPVIFRKGIGPSGWDGVKALAMYSAMRGNCCSASAATSIRARGR